MRTVGFIILGVGVLLFVTSLVLMVVFKVPELIDELSGRKAKRQIKRLKELNEGTGAVEGMATEDFYMSAGGYSITSDMADINDSIVSDSKRLDTSSSDIGEDTDNQQPKEDIVEESEDDEESATEMVDDSDEEDFDAEEAATEMVDDSDEEDSPTDLIDEDDQPTDLLSEEDETSKDDTHIITILEEQSSID